LWKERQQSIFLTKLGTTCTRGLDCKSSHTERIQLVGLIEQINLSYRLLNIRLDLHLFNRRLSQFMPGDNVITRGRAIETDDDSMWISTTDGKGGHLPEAPRSEVSPELLELDEAMNSGLPSSVSTGNYQSSIFRSSSNISTDSYRIPGSGSADASMTTI
jgi:hypothetical protein